VDATFRVCCAALALAAVFSFTRPADADHGDHSCQFTLNIPNLNLYPLRNVLKVGAGGSPEISLDAIIQRPEGSSGRGGKALRIDLDLRIAELKEGGAVQGHQAFWLLDHWFVGGDPRRIRACLERMYQDCVKTFGKSAPTKAVLRAQCQGAARWRVTDRFIAAPDPDNRRWTVYRKKSAKLLQSAECLSASSGKAAGKLGCRNIAFRPNLRIDLTFAHDRVAR